MPSSGFPSPDNFSGSIIGIGSSERAELAEHVPGRFEILMPGNGTFLDGAFLMIRSSSALDTNDPAPVFLNAWGLLFHLVTLAFCLLIARCLFDPINDLISLGWAVNVHLATSMTIWAALFVGSTVGLAMHLAMAPQTWWFRLMGLAAVVTTVWTLSQVWLEFDGSDRAQSQLLRLMEIKRSMLDLLTLLPLTAFLIGSLIRIQFGNVQLVRFQTDDRIANYAAQYPIGRMQLVASGMVVMVFFLVFSNASLFTQVFPISMDVRTGILYLFAMSPTLLFAVPILATSRVRRFTPAIILWIVLTLAVYGLPVWLLSATGLNSLHGLPDFVWCFPITIGLYQVAYGMILWWARALPLAYLPRLGSEANPSSAAPPLIRCGRSQFSATLVALLLLGSVIWLPSALVSRFSVLTFMATQRSDAVSDGVLVADLLTFFVQDGTPLQFGRWQSPGNYDGYRNRVNVASDGIVGVRVSGEERLTSDWRSLYRRLDRIRPQPLIEVIGPIRDLHVQGTLKNYVFLDGRHVRLGDLPKSPALQAVEMIDGEIQLDEILSTRGIARLYFRNCHIVAGDSPPDWGDVLANRGLAQFYDCDFDRASLDFVIAHQCHLGYSDAKKLSEQPLEMAETAYGNTMKLSSTPTAERWLRKHDFSFHMASYSTEFFIYSVTHQDLAKLPKRLPPNFFSALVTSDATGRVNGLSATLMNRVPTVPQAVQQHRPTRLVLAIDSLPTDLDSQPALLKSLRNVRQLAIQGQGDLEIDRLSKLFPDLQVLVISSLTNVDLSQLPKLPELEVLWLHDDHLDYYLGQTANSLTPELLIQDVLNQTRQLYVATRMAPQGNWKAALDQPERIRSLLIQRPGFLPDLTTLELLHRMESQLDRPASQVTAH